MSNNGNIFQILSNAGINLNADTTSEYSASEDTTTATDSDAYTTSEEPTESGSPSAELTDSDYSDILQNMGFEMEESNASPADSDGELEDGNNEDEAILESMSTLTVDHIGAESHIEFRTQGTTRIRIDNSGEITTSDLSSNIRATDHEVPSGPSGEASEQNTQNLDEIPQNSPTLLLKEANSRFSGTEWFAAIQNTDIIIGGMGGISSNLAFQVARMHPRTLIFYDDDTVEEANMSGQLFSNENIGEFKVDAINNMIRQYTLTTNAWGIPEKFTESTPPGPIMMCGFDNMQARKIFFESWCRYIGTVEDRANCLFLDGRLSIDTLQIFAIRGDDDYNIGRYAKEFLFSDDEAEETVCSMKQTTYLACMIASLMTNLFTNFVADTLDPVIPYDLPFFTEYEAQNMLFKTEY